MKPFRPTGVLKVPSPYHGAGLQERAARIGPRRKYSSLPIVLINGMRVRGQHRHPGQAFILAGRWGSPCT